MMHATQPTLIGPHLEEGAADQCPLSHPSHADERCARAAWARLAEPTDAVAQALIESEGAVGAWEAVRSRTHRALEKYTARLGEVRPERDLEWAQAHGTRFIIPSDDEYPASLLDLEHPPWGLWVRGAQSVAALTQRAVAMVGARAATEYGTTIAADFSAELARSGFTVVSGAAFGIDAAAHRGSLAAGGPTLAVLACGVDRPYPAAHARLLGHIAEEGAVVSEMSPGMSPTRYRFLHRNRLIAALTQGTVVAEAALRSGARHTAGVAQRLSRAVCAVPGSITSVQSAGCHEMIRSGQAVLVTRAAEVMEAIAPLGEHWADPPEHPTRHGDGECPEDAQVWDVLPTRGGISAERAAALCGLDISVTLSALGRMELRGAASRGGQGWKKLRRR